MNFKYPRNGVVKVPFYQSTWVAFKEGQMVGCWGGKPDPEMISWAFKAPQELTENERSRYLSCLTTAGYENWKFLHSLKEPLDYISSDEQGVYYYRVFDTGADLHRDDGPAVIRKDGTTDHWFKGIWQGATDINGNVFKSLIKEEIKKDIRAEPVQAVKEPSLALTLFSSLAAVAGLSILGSKLKSKQTKQLKAAFQPAEVYEYEKAK